MEHKFYVIQNAHDLNYLFQINKNIVDSTTEIEQAITFVDHDIAYSFLKYVRLLYPTIKSQLVCITYTSEITDD